MKTNALTLKRTSFAIDRRAIVRSALVCATILLAAIAYYFQNAATARIVANQAAKDRDAWQTMSASNNASLDAFVAIWSAQRAKSAEQTTVNWVVRDARDLRASLLAWDATKSATQRVTVSKRDSGYAVNVETAP
jgi:hypothetical protein